MKNSRTGYHFCDGSRLSHHDGRVIKPGVTFSLPGVDVGEVCGQGLHASPTPRQAWNFVQGNVLSKVKVWNKGGRRLRTGYDKFAGAYRKHLVVAKIPPSAIQRLNDTWNITEFNRLCAAILVLYGKKK
jgi:hypothetical protein